jgi:hypothetical protein
VDRASIAFGVEGVAPKDDLLKLASELIDSCLRLGELHLELRVGELTRVGRELTGK